MTNTEIQQGFYDALIDANLGYPIAYPAIDFTPPASGVWLEISFFPNRGIDDLMANDSQVIPQGMFQVMAVTRPGDGLFPVTNAAQSVMMAMPKGTRLADLVRTNRHPYQSDAVKEGDRVMIPVTLEYSS